MESHGHTPRTSCRTALSLCFTLSLESTPCFPPTTQYRFLCFSDSPFPDPMHFFPCRFTTLLIHYPITLSLTALNVPVLQILLTIDSFPPPELIPGLLDRTVSFEHICFCFSFSFLIFRFLANVNSRSRSLYAIPPSVCRLSVCRLSSFVCLSSVTLVRPTQAVQIFANISTAFGTLAIR